MCVLVCEHAACGGGRAEIVVVHPHVGRILGPLLHRHRLVVRVRFVGAATHRDIKSSSKQQKGHAPKRRKTGRGGGDKLSHVVRATAEARPQDCWVALDLSNAFGTMLRDQALTEAAKVVPGYRAYLAMFLERDTRYRFIRSRGGAVWMTAGEGAGQGDVWGPILYSLALAPCVARLEEALRDKL